MYHAVIPQFKSHSLKLSSIKNQILPNKSAAVSFLKHVSLGVCARVSLRYTHRNGLMSPKVTSIFNEMKHCQDRYSSNDYI